MIKGIRKAYEENKMLKLLGRFWETEIVYDPVEKAIAAQNRAIGTRQQIQPSFILLGNLQRVVTMAELSAWIAARLAELCGEDLGA